MIKEFRALSDAEQAILLKAPVWISVLASCSYKTINAAQKQDAIQLSHLKTFTAHPLLLSYYREVEKIFKDEFDAALENFYPFDAPSVAELKKKVSEVNKISQKLDSQYRTILLKSFHKYETHVKRAGHSVIEDFIFPIPIPGLTK